MRRAETQVNFKMYDFHLWKSIAKNTRLPHTFSCSAPATEMGNARTCRRTYKNTSARVDRTCAPTDARGLSQMSLSHGPLAAVWGRRETSEEMQCNRERAEVVARDKGTSGENVQEAAEASLKTTGMWRQEGGCGKVLRW